MFSVIFWIAQKGLYLFIYFIRYPMILVIVQWFADNLQYGHFAYVDFNTVNFWYGIILNKCTPWDLIDSAKTIACLSVIDERYFWYFFRVMAFIIYAPFHSYYIFLWFHINLIHSIELHHFTGFFNPVLYVLMCVIYFWSYTNLYEWLFLF